MAKAPSHPPRKTGPDEQGGHRLDFPVVGIGASTGGIDALQQFLGHMPDAVGMAFVVVLHPVPDRDRDAAAILQRHTGMPVVQLSEPAPIAPDHVYLAAPDQDLVLEDGWLRPCARPHQPGVPVAIDLFLRTLAQAQGPRAVCAVLSGTGSDGATGLKRIKEMGGVAMAQSPDDARFAEMPRAAIATEMVDFVLPAAAMPARLVALWRTAQRISLPPGEPDDDGLQAPVGGADPDAAEAALHDILDQLHTRSGHDFRHYRRATVLRRIGRRMQVCTVPDLPAYANHLRGHAEESAALLQDMLISVTHFFRDRDAFDALERDVVPALFDRRASADTVRAWVAGCATGEEAYSLGILLREAAEQQAEPPPLQIFATDIDERALAVARAGAYPAGIAADVTAARLERHFVRAGDGWRVGKQLREPVLFAAHNVLRDPPFSRLDLICCRNLLIYVGRQAQTRILEMFRFALRPGGFLFLGSSESADVAGSLFTVVDKKNRIYRAAPYARASRLRSLASVGAGGRVAAPFSPPPVASRERTAGGVAQEHMQAIAQYARPSVLVDEKLAILHLSDGAGRYLAQAGGLPTTDLLPNVRPALRLELRSALLQLSHGGERIDTRSVPFEHGGRHSRVRLSVCPVGPPEAGRRQVLVIFDETPGPQDGPPLPDHPAERQMAVRYEREVEQLRAQLHDTVEQAGLSTEELKASNEELQAINEELRSATEELETTKEELQSMNAELFTVNVELKTQVEEAGRVNDDLQNFIQACDIATVFVDRGMRIKRFTPQAAAVFNVIATDIGRPLLDITHRLHYDALAEDIAQVFDHLRLVERPVQSVDGGRHYLARIRPYRTRDHQIAGAVLTFLEVTELRQMRQALLDR